MNIELLADHAESIPMLAGWYVSEWGPYYGKNGPGDACADLESRCHRDEIPLGLVAIEDGAICGTAALDLDVATGLSPSVVGLLVARPQRGRGVATAMLESAEALARRLGYSRLYISTTVLGDVLVRMQWREHGDVEFIDEQRGLIYARDLTTFQNAVPEEAAYLSALALRSKAHWGYSSAFMESCKRELTYRPGQIADDRFHFVVAKLGSLIVGFYALEAIAPKQFELDALFVEPEHIGTGLGRKLIEHALETVKAKSGKSVLIQGDPNAEKFYLDAGAKLIGTRESGSIAGRDLPLFEILL